MHWVVGLMQKIKISANKTMVLFQLPPYVFQLVGIIKGGKNPTFSSRCIGFLVLMQKTLISVNKTMVSFELLPYVFRP